MKPTPNAVRTPQEKAQDRAETALVKRMAGVMAERILSRGRLEKEDLAQAGFSRAQIEAHTEAAILIARTDAKVGNLIAEAA